MTLLALFCAHAQVLSVSGTGGMDYPTANPWTGVELGMPASQQTGVGFQGRLAPGWGFIDRSPFVLVEGGASVVIPEKTAIVRLGVLGRGVALSTFHPLPIQPGGIPTPTRRQFGVVPSVLATLEFEFTPETPLTLGFKGGLGSVGSGQQCQEGVDPAFCTSWYPGFVGGFSVRKRFDNGLTLEGIAGTVSSVSVGYSFGLGS